MKIESKYIYSRTHIYYVHTKIQLHTNTITRKHLYIYNYVYIHLDSHKGKNTYGYAYISTGRNTYKYIYTIIQTNKIHKTLRHSNVNTDINKMIHMYTCKHIYAYKHIHSLTHRKHTNTAMHERNKIWLLSQKSSTFT